MPMINVIFQLNVPSKERMTEFLRKENEGLYNKV